MKKVLIFSTAYFPLIGGAEIAIKEITDRLGGDFVFDLICARIKKDLPKKEKIGNINVYRVGCGCAKLDKFLLPWRGSCLAKQLHQQEKYDIAWAIMASFGGLAALFFKNKFKEVPYLLTLQEGDSPEHIASRAKWVGSYFKKIFISANFITAISNYLADWAKSIGAKCPIEVVPNGASFRFEEYIERDKLKPEIREKINKIGQLEDLQKSDKLIITVSRLVEKNGVEYLIRAMKELPANYKLRIVGDGPLRKKLESLKESFGLKERVFFHGEISPNEIRWYYYNSHENVLIDRIKTIFVRPSLSEGLGNVFFEAMHLFVPVIGTKVGGITDFLEDKRTGYFCEVKNPYDIAEKIKYVFNENQFDEVRQVRFVARQLVQDIYNWDKITEKMKAIFDRLTL